jgi:hypothetical protein
LIDQTTSALLIDEGTPQQSKRPKTRSTCGRPEESKQLTPLRPNEMRSDSNAGSACD